jgi:hypothetical protein
MIGPLSSSLALAQRTVAKARATMDATARQIATGKAVASVKDDGARWAMGQQVAGEGATWGLRRDVMTTHAAHAAMIQTANEDALTLMRESQTALAFAATTAPNSDARRNALREWEVLRGRAANLQTQVDAIVDLVGSAAIAVQPTPNEWGWRPGGADPFLADLTVPFARMGTSITAGVNSALYTPSVYAVDQDFMGASQGLMAQAAAEQLNSGSGVSRLNWIFVPYSGGATAKAERMADFAGEARDRADAFAAALTDADLPKVSAARAQAETRQQIALDTIKNALTAYGNYAGGLLGNVQRSQRSVLA